MIALPHRGQIAWSFGQIWFSVQCSTKTVKRSVGRACGRTENIAPNRRIARGLRTLLPRSVGARVTRRVTNETNHVKPGPGASKSVVAAERVSGEMGSFKSGCDGRPCAGAAGRNESPQHGFRHTVWVRSYGRRLSWARTHMSSYRLVETTDEGPCRGRDRHHQRLSRRL